MKKDSNLNNEIKLIGEKVGTVFVEVYNEIKSNKFFFYIKSENEMVEQVSYVIEDTLYNF